MLAKNARGFTVVELLVAIAIFGIVIPSLTMAVTSLTTTNNRARDLTLVNTLINNKAEQLRGVGFNSLIGGTYSFTNELPTSLGKPKSASYNIDTTTPGMAVITFTVSYKDYTKTRTQTYRTIVSELGVAQ